MSWRCWIVIAAHWVVLIAVLLVSRSCQSEWEAKDVGRQEDIKRYQFLAKDAGERAATASENANELRRQVVVAEAEIAALTEHLQPITHEPCRVPVSRRDRIIKKQKEQINIHKATEEMLRNSLLARDTQILNLETALGLQERRAEGWKKSASKSKRDKILIGVGSAIGGAGVMALGVWGAGQL